MRKSIWIAALTILLMIGSIVSAQPPVVGSQSSLFGAVTDSAQLLSDGDKQSLINKVKSLEDKHGVRIGIVTLRSARGQRIDAVADAMLDSYFSGGRNGSIDLVIVMDTREWHISTDAQMQRRITSEAGISYIQRQFVSSMSDGDFNGAFIRYLAAIDELLTYYEQNNAPYTGSSGGFNPMALMIAIIVAVIIGMMYRSSLISAMSNVRPAVEAIEYLDKGSVQLIENRDTFLFMNVVRQPKSRGGGRPQGGSGGGGGGGHGGGGGSF